MRPSDRLPDPLRPQEGRIRTIAHRGDSSAAPENTIAAFEAAVAARSDLIEIDLRRTADGEAAVIHDESALRTTGLAEPVGALSSGVLAAADAGSWFDAAYAGIGVPMFGEVAAWGADQPDVGWLVELKGSWTAAELEGPVEAVRRHGLAGRTILQSFEPDTVAAARAAAPDLPRALLVWGRQEPDALVERLEGLEAAGCNPIGTLPNEMPRLAARLREAGYSVFPWTLDEPDEWGAAGGAGVDGVITNRPGQFRSWHAQRWSPVGVPALAS